MSEFVPNPAFLPHVENATLRELDDIREEMYQEAKSGQSPASIADKVTIRSTPAKRTGSREVGVFVGYGKGLGPIFEGGTGARFTKGKGRKRKYPAGVHRGRITTANRAMQRAQDNAVRRGLSLRYL